MRKKRRAAPALTLLAALTASLGGCDTDPGEQATQRDVYTGPNAFENCVADWGNEALCQQRLTEEEKKKYAQQSGGGGGGSHVFIYGPGVARIVKQRVYEMLKARTGRRKVSGKQLKEMVAAYSGHSMRVGHITSAAERGVPSHHIKRQSGHKTDQMISLYSRVTDARKNSSLKGSGL